MKNNILIISHLYPTPDSPTRGIFVHHQTQSLQKTGIKVTVISPQVFGKKKVDKNFKIDGINVLAPRYISLGKHLSFITGLTGYLGARKLMKQFSKPDIILAHTALPDGGIARRIAQRFQIPYFVYVHGADVQKKTGYNPWVRRTIVNTLKDAKKVLANSSKTQWLLQELGVDSRVIPMGVDKINLKRKTKNPKEIRIVSVCNLEEEKGIRYAIEAVRSIKDEKIRYDIIGDGSEMDKLQDLTAGDDRIRFLGRQNQEKLFQKLAGSDIFLLPSYNEAFGVAYLEAMSAGLPIIGVKGQGVEDIIAKGVCGILIEPRSIVSISDALRELIRDEDLREKMGKTGQEIVRKHYLWDEIVPKLLKEMR